MSKATWLALASLAAVGCAEIDEEGVDRESRAYVSSPTIWPEATIPVCWENPHDTDVIERTWVREAVEQTWESVSAVRFTGWEACDVDSRGIRIEIIDGQALTYGLGQQLDGAPGAMHLNFTYKSWNPGCRYSLRESCIRVDAVHEFGHALGFAHEQNRSDRPATCTDAPAGDLGDMVLGAYDPDSVMNYCNPVYDKRTWPWVMSAGDSFAAQRVYGLGPRRGIDRSVEDSGPEWH